MAHIFQLNTSTGGVPKLPLPEAMLTANGIVGDKQRQTRFHGGPERAVCLYAFEIIEHLRSEGHPITPGSAGDNITTIKLDWSRVKPGARLAIGDEVMLEISSYTVPCRTIAASFVDGDFKRISQKLHPGESRVYARVLQTGRLAVGQQIEILD